MKIEYPSLNLKAKKFLAKRLSNYTKKYSHEDILRLIDYCEKNKDNLWIDHLKSDVENLKIMRASRGELWKLLKLINKALLAPYDNLLSSCIHGGVRGKSNITAVKSMLNERKNRFLLRIDLSSFYEQIDIGMVHGFFYGCGCSHNVAKLLSNMCCIRKGEKTNPENEACLARGFSPSARLAIWCNYNFFVKIQNLINRKLKKYNPKIAIYVDDIGITASGISEKKLTNICDEIINIAKNDKITVNMKKTEILSPTDTQEHLGIKMHYKTLSLSNKTKSKKKVLLNKIKTNKHNKKDVKSLNGIRVYENELRKNK